MVSVQAPPPVLGKKPPELLPAFVAVAFLENIEPQVPPRTLDVLGVRPVVGVYEVFGVINGEVGVVHPPPLQPPVSTPFIRNDGRSRGDEARDQGPESGSVSTTDWYHPEVAPSVGERLQGAEHPGAVHDVTVVAASWGDVVPVHDAASVVLAASPQVTLVDLDAPPSSSKGLLLHCPVER